jgi:hypothetical protein
VASHTLPPTGTVLSDYPPGSWTSKGYRMSLRRRGGRTRWILVENITLSSSLQLEILVSHCTFVAYFSTASAFTAEPCLSFSHTRFIRAVHVFGSG